MTEIDLETQARMLAALVDSAAFDAGEGAVERLQTHISYVILAGEFAYKIKKPLDLGFLDFSTLERRKFCCEEELRLNRRTAPDLYLEVLPITGTPDAPSLGGDGAVLDYTVKMRRFPQSGLLSEALPDVPTLLQLARQVAEFHQSIPQAEAASPLGTPERVMFPMLENFSQIREIGVGPQDAERLNALEDWTRGQGERLQELLQRRKREGHIRECHGDMHLGNITRYQGKLEIFDGIEFNPNLSWIDTLNDVAFLLMDLRYRGLHQAAAVFLNEYLAQTGDYAAVSLLPFYQCYRAMVRAKVAAIRGSQAGHSVEEQDRIEREFTGYLELAREITRTSQPVLLMMHGLSGSGKSLFGGWLAERLPALRLRSDVERKRLFPATGETQGLEQGIYNPAATQETYAHLRGLARDLLLAGYSVIVDATFLKAAQRDSFSRLAAELELPWLILDCVAPEATLRERILARQAEGADPSDADLRVLELQLESREPFTEQELAGRVEVDTRQRPSDLLLKQLSERLALEG